jgi:hypothetical protein
MSVGIISDLTLVLVLQAKREAIQTAISLVLTPLQETHVVFATLATLLYVPMLVTGPVLLRRAGRAKGDPSPRLKRAHVALGTAAFAFRTISFILMFSMLSRVHGG